MQIATNPLPQVGNVIYSLYDDFNRADGALGTAPTGHLWAPTGGAIPAIVSGKMVNDAGSAGYAFVDMRAKPRGMSARFSFSTGTPGANIITLLNENLSITALTSLVHLYISNTVWNLQLGDPGSFTSPLGNVNLSTALATDGTIYSISITVSGSTATILLPDNTEVSITHALIGTYWGRYCSFETIWDTGEPQPRFESVVVAA